MDAGGETVRGGGGGGEGIGLGRKREKLVAFSSSVNYSWPVGLRRDYRHGKLAANYNSSGLPKVLLGGGRGQVGRWLVFIYVCESVCLYVWVAVGCSFLMAFHHITFCQDWKCLHLEGYWHNYDENLVGVGNENENRTPFLSCCSKPTYSWQYGNILYLCIVFFPIFILPLLIFTRISNW